MQKKYSTTNMINCIQQTIELEIQWPLCQFQEKLNKHLKSNFQSAFNLMSVIRSIGSASFFPFTSLSLAISLQHYSKLQLLLCQQFQCFDTDGSGKGIRPVKKKKTQKFFGKPTLSNLEWSPENQASLTKTKSSRVTKKLQTAYCYAHNYATQPCH